MKQKILDICQTLHEILKDDRVSSALVFDSNTNVGIIRLNQLCPAVDVDAEEIQITSETKGYVLTDRFNWLPIKLSNYEGESFECNNAYIVNGLHIFELTDAVVSKETNELKFSAATLYE